MVQKILMVEDSESDQFLYKTVIEKYNPAIEVLQAYDGQEAMDMITKDKIDPDLILLDINMPRMNGFEFLETLSANSSIKIPVVAMLTSSIHKEDQEKAFRYPCVKNFLTKPLTADNINELEKFFQKGE